MSAAPGLDPGAIRSGASAVSSRRRPPLALVPARRPGAAAGAALGRTPFVVVVVALLAAGLLGLLLLNAVLAQDAFRLHALKQDRRALSDTEQVLRREVEALRAPEALAARAGALGMVPAGPPAFLRLPDGVVLGAGDVADAPAVAGAPEPGAPGTAAPDADAPDADAPDADASEADASGSAAPDAAAPEAAAEDAP